MKHLLVLLTLFPLFLQAQDTTGHQRAPYKLSVAVDKKTVYQQDLVAGPYIQQNNTVQIYPGETIYVEVEQENGTIKSMTAVKQIVNPTKTLTISFTQVAKKKEHVSMMLAVANPFPMTLVYHAKIFLLSQNKWADTSIYPVPAGLSGYETWPDVITSIGMANWAFTAK